MPEIELKHVVSCSSEDKVYCANNLLKADTYRKWKSDSTGLKQITVILQLDKTSKICSVHIGNAGSAFIEVLVGRSAWTQNEDYKVLLVASSFMSPQESKNGTNLNRVRMFDVNQLSKSVVHESWDRIKVVCTQPYNKNCTYGISFIKLMSPAENADSKSGEEVLPVSNFGAFTINKTEDNKFVPGSLFRAHTKEIASSTKIPDNRSSDDRVIKVEIGVSDVDNDQKIPTRLTTTAHNKSATVSSPSASFSSSIKRKPNIREDFFDKKSPDNKPQSSVAPPPIKKTRVKPRESLDEKKHFGKEIKEQIHVTKAAVQENRKKEIMDEDEGDGLSDDDENVLSGVTAVLSGFENPLRGQLRTQLLTLGGIYNPVWDTSCTHLICAFKNTPKYNQVRNTNATIVSRKWLTDCYKHRKRLSTKKYSLRSDDEGSSEDDIGKPKRKPETKVVRSKNLDKVSDATTSTSSNVDDKSTSSQLISSGAGAQVKDNIRTTCEVVDVDENAATLPLDLNSSRPSDDEENYETKFKTEDKASSKDNLIDDPYDCSTEEEEDYKQDSPKDKSILPSYFSGYHFLIYGDYSYDERRRLTRYLTAYDGIVEEYMNKNVNIVITDDDWDDKFDEALTEFPHIAFVQSRWVYDCHNEQQYLPYQRFLLTP